MTKQRPPLSFNRALTKIAALVGWDTAAILCNVAERTVRKWSDPDTDTHISLRDALRLDRAYQEAGGIGAPLFECYALRLEIEGGADASDVETLIEASSATAKEAGEAVAALIRASRPDATPRERLEAVKEAEDAIQALTVNINLIGTGGSQ